MHIVIKGTKTIKEYKQTQQEMTAQAVDCYAAHQSAVESWTEGEPVKVWKDADALCIEYTSGHWWHYKQTETGLEWW